MDKTYLKNILISVVTSVLSLFFIFYIINQVNIIGKNDVTIQYVTTDSAEVSADFEGILSYSEQIVYSSAGSAFVPGINDGTGIEKGQEIGKLYPSVYNDTVELIAKLDREIAYLEYCSDVRGGSLDNVDYDKKLKDSYSLLIDSLASGNLSSVYSASDSWLTAKSRRNVSIGIISGYGQQIAELKERRDALIDGMGGSTGKVFSSCSGIYYSFLDGYEQSFNSDIAVSGDYSQLMGLFDNDNKSNTGDMGIGKVVSSGKWYTVCRVPSEKAALVTVGNTYTARFEENGMKVNLLLERAVTEYKKDTVVLVFSCDTDIDEFIRYRRMSFSLILGDYNGLGIPCSAVRYVDGNIGVYIVDGNKARFRKIEIITESGGRYIVKDRSSDQDEIGYVSLYDSIITSGKNVYDGRYVELG